MVFEWFGSYLCLDAVNTEMVIEGAPTELWPDFVAFARWLDEAGLFSASELEQLEAWPDAEKGRVLAAARLLRRTVRAMCEEIAAQKTVSETTLDALNLILARRATFEMLEKNETHITRRESISTDGEDVLVPIARSAARLLSEGDLSLLKKCSNPACILWFYDQTKNRGRRWCSMATCGNRHKAAAHYARRKAET